MTDREQLLHLADRARRGVALPAEHDALAAGIAELANDRDRAQRSATYRLDMLRKRRQQMRDTEQRAEQAEAERDELHAALGLVPGQLHSAAVSAIHGRGANIRELATRAEQAEAAIERVRRLCDLTIATSVRVQAIQQARDTLTALDQPQQPTLPGDTRTCCTARIGHLPTCQANQQQPTT